MGEAWDIDDIHVVFIVVFSVFISATDVSVSEVTIDGRDLAWGGISFTSTVNVNVGPQVMVIGFQGSLPPLYLFKKSLKNHNLKKRNTQM